MNTHERLERERILVLLKAAFSDAYHKLKQLFLQRLSQALDAHRVMAHPSLRHNAANAGAGANLAHDAGAHGHHSPELMRACTTEKQTCNLN